MKVSNPHYPTQTPVAFSHTTQRVAITTRTNQRWELIEMEDGTIDIRCIGFDGRDQIAVRSQASNRINIEGVEP